MLWMSGMGGTQSTSACLSHVHDITKEGETDTREVDYHSQDQWPMTCSLIVGLRCQYVSVPKSCYTGQRGEAGAWFPPT
jgi:NADH pyrophosphatase NudC (nudix superfamily)